MKRPLIWMTSISLATLTIFAFQNCGVGFKTGGSADESSNAIDKPDPFFEYPYGATPEFYVDAFVFKPTAATNLAEFKFLGVVTKSSSYLDDTDYIVTFKDADGSIVCPALTGTLSGGASSIISNCLTTRTPSSLTVKLELHSAGQKYLLERTY